MKIVNPNVELIPQTDSTTDGIFKQIEICGRTCYKSEDKITDDSASKFIDLLINNKHYAMLEHGTVYLKMEIDWKSGSNTVSYKWYNEGQPVKYREIFNYVRNLFERNPYSIVNIHYDRDDDEYIMCITTNYRVIIENGPISAYIMHEFMCSPTIYHTPRFTFKVTTNIGVTREGNRMRANSIAEESTRYCNYTKEKFGNELNICPPVWLTNDDKNRLINFTKIEWLQAIMQIVESEDLGGELKHDVDYYGAALMFCNICYNKLIKRKWKPQQAREVLPLATKSDIIYTAFPHQWRHFFDLRLFGKTGTPHPNMKLIAQMMCKRLIENDLWHYVYNRNEPEFKHNPDIKY